MWFFSVLGFALEEKLHGAKCCKFYGPEKVHMTHLHDQLSKHMSNTTTYGN